MTSNGVSVIGYCPVMKHDLQILHGTNEKTVYESRFIVTADVVS
jgi:hypothetical protein